MVRAIVFDLFDTLVDHDHDHERLAPVEVEGRRVGATTPALHARARDEFGVDLSLLAFAERLHDVDAALRVDTVDVGVELSTLDRFTALGTALGLSEPLVFGAALTEVHMGALAQAVSVPSHHEAILTSLAIDHRLGICSNFTHAATARSILDRAGMTGHLSAITISEEVGIRKPRVEIFTAVAEALEVDPTEILHVGDDLRADVAGAAALGMRTVWLTRRIRDPERMLADYDGPKPDFSLEDLLDLPVLVARLGR